LVPVFHACFLPDTAPTDIYTLSLHDALPICQRTGAEAEADGDRCEHGEQTRGGQLALRVQGHQVDHAAVLGLAGALHDSRDLPELAADLPHHGACRAGDRVDGQTGEQEHDRGTDDDADQDVRVDHL